MKNCYIPECSSLIMCDDQKYLKKGQFLYNVKYFICSFMNEEKILDKQYLKIYGLIYYCKYYNMENEPICDKVLYSVYTAPTRKKKTTLINYYIEN